MKNVTGTKSATSDRNDGYPRISHTPNVSGKGRAPVLVEGLMQSARTSFQKCSSHSNHRGVKTERQGSAWLQP